MNSASHVDVFGSECGAVLAFPHPLYSGCLAGCIENRRDESVGGARYNVTDLDMAFMGNVVDSLLAIRDICFVRKLCPFQEYLECVRSNWKIRPELRACALQAPHCMMISTDALLFSNVRFTLEEANFEWSSRLIAFRTVVRSESVRNDDGFKACAR